MTHAHPWFAFHPEIAAALKSHAPVVALESTVITHGLPAPENLALAQDMEKTVRANGAHPATIAVLDRRIWVGLDAAQLEQLASASHPRKISVRDFAPALAQSAVGGTTVAATLFAAHEAGIRVFATGGIGGVHRGDPTDVSADLPQMQRTPMILVCAGAKSILNLPATLEYLETAGVPVIGYQTDEFPAFFSRESGLPVSARADSPAEIVQMAMAHWGLGMTSTLLVAAPPPLEVALPHSKVDEAIQQALDEASAKGVRGQAVTPFLLSRVNALTHSASLQANLGLLKNNAAIAAQIAVELAKAAFPKTRSL